MKPLLLAAEPGARAERRRPNEHPARTEGPFDDAPESGLFGPRGVLRQRSESPFGSDGAALGRWGLGEGSPPRCMAERAASGAERPVRRGKSPFNRLQLLRRTYTVITRTRGAWIQPRDPAGGRYFFQFLPVWVD